MDARLERVLAPLVDRIVRPIVDERVAAALAAHRREDPHASLDDLLEHALVYGDRAKLHVDPTAVVNNALFNLSSGEITVGEYAFFGHNVCVLTGTHDVTVYGRPRQTAVPKTGRDVVIGPGAWVSTGALVLGPCTIGENAVVAAGALVAGDVAPYEVVAGVPARVVRRLTPPGAAAEPAGALEAADGAAELRPPAGGVPGFADVYPQFEARFRGAEDDIRDRLRVYLPDLDAASTGLPVVDLGPGRGEWLGLVAERGLEGYGVDTDAAFVAAAASRGLRVVRADAVEHLRGLAPGSVDLVSAFHVIEHLPTDRLLALLTAARAALRPGGTLLLETPNPANLVMGASNFWLDPTHRRPLPAALGEFLVQAAGFVDVEVRPLHPRERVDLGGLKLDGVKPKVARMVGAELTRAFFGPQDYGIVAGTPA